jgi:hypothetical protein
MFSRKREQGVFEDLHPPESLQEYQALLKPKDHGDDTATPEIIDLKSEEDIIQWLQARVDD